MKSTSSDLKAKAPPWIAFALLLGLALISNVHAQYEIKSGVYNRLSSQVPANNTSHFPPVGPHASPVGEPTSLAQYANVVESSASAGPKGINGTGSTATTTYPSSPTITLRSASIGTSFASGVPRYFFGDQITQPTSVMNQAGVVLDTSAVGYWRTEPIRPGEYVGGAVDYRTGLSSEIPVLPEGVKESFYYSPHAKRVFANTPGNVSVTWRSSVAGSSGYVYYKETFSVSSSTGAPVRTMFWTEKSFNGPRITIPPGRIVTVNPVYSNVFPETVTTEYVVVGSSAADPNAAASEVLRTLWYEKSNGTGELHAYNHEGRILVEYLGEVQEDGTYAFLGADIINVQQSLQARTLTTNLGQEIRPNPDANLIAMPIVTTSTNQVSYYGSNPRPDGSLAYYAERENDIEDRVTFYWLETNDAGIAKPAGSQSLSINWPKYLNKYILQWPQNATDFTQYTVGANGSSVATGTGLKFEDGKIPQLVYQDSTNGESLIDTVTQRMIVNLTGDTDGKNLTLLKFTGSNGGVWYVPLMTQSETRTGYQEGDGSTTGLTGAAFVGERIRPPSSTYVSAGYISSGTSYSPNAYVDPFASGVTAAQKGAIIPVNALPGSKNPLTVWWFQKVAAKSAEFADFYVPSKIVRYTVAYRTSQSIAAENFDSNPSGWSVNTAGTGIANTTGKFLGPFGHVTTTQATQKTFSVNSSSVNGAEISFTFYRMDSWENENFRVTVNDNMIIDQKYSNTEVTATTTGSKTVGTTTYSWNITPVPGGYSNFYGATAVDQAFHVSIAATPVSGASIASLTVGFTSTLDSAASDESFAIDDFDITLPLPRIVLASNQGTGSLITAIAGGSLYNQPDPTKIGYNPNEEHAMMLNNRGYALRDDLNVLTSDNTFSSSPRVLIQYTDPNDGLPAISVYEVVRENSLYRFSYPITAATILSSPMPLPLIPLPVDSSGAIRNAEVTTGATTYSDPATGSGAPSSYMPFTYKDRKGYDWVYRGPHGSNVNASLGMQFHYVMRSEFNFPSLTTQPAAGTILPYLRAKNTSGAFVGDPVNGTPLTVLYYPKWPTSPPTMSIGETLSLPNHDLPAVRGQTSARVMYQQSIANTGTSTPSVTLQDATRAKSVLINASSVGLTALPASLKTTQQNGKTYFQLAQPHLQQRFYFNPNLGDIGGLELIGEFKDEIAGEDYLNLNTLSPGDVNALNILVDSSDPDRGKWEAAIRALFTTVETFKENPTVKGTYIVDSTKTVSVGAQALPEISYSDTAVDSYALTAIGKGSGYVTLLFGDGAAFTPSGEPVAMQVVKVVPQLYKGDLKMIPASNPLDEQTTLRHSGDFAAHPENYDFEWRYALPVDGVVPPTYHTAMTRVMGSTSATAWHKISNPSSVPQPVASYTSGSAVALPGTFNINVAPYVANSGAAGQILKNDAGVTFANSLPDQVIFSAQVGSGDGFVLFVNGQPALAYQIPSNATIPGNLTPQAPRSGLASSSSPSFQFEVDPSFFVIGANTVEVALYSTSTTASTIDFCIDVPVKTDLVSSTGSPWQTTSGSLTNTVVIGGSAASPLGDPLLVFSDAYFTMRYKPKASANLVTTATSEWMTPVLVESWVKRVLDGINPFNQRQTDLYNNPVTTDVSILTQAGHRWEGDVALNLTNIDDFGLIEIYETVLNRVKQQSLEAGITTDSVDSTLLLVAGYLNDLYMTLGNEAWDDAQNPTILIDGDVDSSSVSSARFSFEGEVGSMMQETLALLRGRDDFLSPGTSVGPAYNRLYWNYTNGISSGESIYAVNYNIKEKSGSANANGVIDAADAQAMFPQGHGDAYGHYLTALTGYYKLLTSPVFTWIPTTEAVSVLGQTVQVDYQDERKFAAAAASLATTAVDILDFTARDNHEDGEEFGWSNKHDTAESPLTDVARDWGTDEWSSRGFQGAYYNWVSANAMLPDVDKKHEGIQKIDRTTVPEINEIVTSANKIMTLSDGEQAHLNPLGLAKDAMTFDISASELAAGKTHFEQIYERATKASVNAKNAFQQAGKMNQLLRKQNNTADDYNEAVERQEDAYNYRLITLFGTAYAGDIGPGKLYAQGYTGPDLYHSYYIDRPSPLVSVGDEVTVSFREPINHDPFKTWSIDNVYNKLNDPVQYTTKTFKISPYSLGQFSDTVATGLGKRGQTGSIQSALLECYAAQVNLRESSNTFSNLVRRFDRDYQLYSEFLTDYDAANSAAAEKTAQAAAMSKASFTLTTSAAAFALSADYLSAIAAASAEAAPTSVGLANDVTSVARAITLLTGETSSFAQSLLGLAADTKAALLDAEAADLQGEADGYIDDYNFDSVKKQHVVEFERLYDDVLATSFEMTRRLTELQAATEKVSRLYADANHVLSERETFRQRAASVIQGYRTRDMVYRDFRNEELAQYKSLFDLAQTFTYCATKAYDYETGLLNSKEGEDFINQIIGTYSVGDWQGDNPVESGSGDSGLASILSGLRDDWQVAKGRLGINNPDRNGTVFSLRQELFRIPTDKPTADDNLLWKQVLQQHMMSNVLNDPDVGIYCNNIRKADGSAVPGIVISFSTTINQGLNFFGWPLAAGDHYFSQSSFATKIHSSGLVFKGYTGMDPYTLGTPGTTGPASSGTYALSATPYAYLIPAGMDSMRAPAFGDTNVVRSWSVKDQALPLPKNLGLTEFSANQFFTPQGSVNEQLWIARKHQAFRAVDDPAYFYSSMPAEFTNTRLIGRSVWNGEWKIVIPAYSLLANEQTGLDRFAQTVTDIQLFLRTYSTSGN